MVGLFDHRLGGVPIDAAISNGDAVLEVFDRLREGLCAVVDVTFDHGAYDAWISEALLNQLFEDGWLTGRIFGAVRVAAIGHDRWSQFRCF